MFSLFFRTKIAFKKCKQTDPIFFLLLSFILFKADVVLLYQKVVYPPIQKNIKTSIRFIDLLVWKIWAIKTIAYAITPLECLGQAWGKLPYFLVTLSPNIYN